MNSEENIDLFCLKLVSACLEYCGEKCRRSYENANSFVVCAVNL